MKKLTAIILMIFCLVAFGCNCKSQDPESDVENVVDRNNALIYEGVTDYKIVVPENADSYVTKAVSELNLFFEESTGTAFNVIADTGISYSSSAKYISIGNTSLLSDAGISVEDDELYRSGYIIKKEGESYFLTGRTSGLSYGPLYAVYGFLNKFLNYEYFAPNCYSLDKNISTLPNKDLDIISIPDISQRCLGFYNLTTDSVYMDRMRLEKYNDTKTWITAGHSQTDIVNPKSLGAEHPDWFSPDQKTVCLESEGMREYLVDKLKTLIAANPEGTVVHLGQADNDSICTCDKCEEFRVQKGMNFSGQQIAFLNDISDRLTPWVQEHYPGRDIIFTGFAYVYSEQAPCVYNENTGKYEPFSEYVVPRDNVSIYWAPIRNDFSKTINDTTSVHNSPSYLALRAWHDLLGDEKIYMWSYCTNFRNYFVNMNNFCTFAENYRIYAENGIKYIFDQGSVDSGATTFEELRIYLQSNLMWDTSLDYNELVLKFMKNYYGAAWQKMYEYFASLNSYYAGIQKDNGFIGTVYYSIGDTEYWSIGVLNYFARVLDNAIEVIEKSYDEEDRQEFLDRIGRIYMSVDYLYMQHYRGNFTNEQIMQKVSSFERLKEKYNIFSDGEGVLVDVAMNNWLN